MESVINVENFYFAYKKSDLVLRDINFEIKKGSFTVITGPSGAGKTTLCKAMTGIVPYYMGGRYSGDVKINGESTKGKRVSDIAMRVGFIMEDYESQLVSLTAGEEIAFSLLNHGFAPHEVEERTRQALEDVGLPGRESYQLDELSGGQRQRLLLAATLAVHPEIIVLDEPVSAMDPDGARSLYKLVDKIHKQYGTTIIAVEHRVDYVLPYVTDMIVLNDGELVAAEPLRLLLLKCTKIPHCVRYCRHCGRLSWAWRKSLAWIWAIGAAKRMRWLIFAPMGLLRQKGELTDVRSKGCQFRLYARTACNQGYGLQDRGRRICGAAGT